MEEIILDYSPRDVFLPYHESDRRFCLSIAHRRCGKTVARINKLIKSAVECELPNPRFGYLAPSFVQAKDIAWTYLKHYSAPITALGGRANESELSVVLPHNNATIRLYGAENAQRMNGVYFDGICIDEGQLIPSSVLSTIIMPCLADRKGWLDVAGKPRGWQNMLGELYKEHVNDPDWFIQVLKASQTEILDPVELAMQRRMMSDDEYQQEFECSFDAALTGAVYGKWMQAAQDEGRINDNVEYDPNYPVFTAWDLGYGDATVIWFYQVGPNEILFIDYYEYSGEGIKHYCDLLKEKNYAYLTHFVPHDAAFKLQAANGRSMVDQARAEGISLTVLPETGHADSIEGSRVTLPRSWFNATRCHKGLEALRNYHFEWDENLRIYRRKPRHDWASHASRAFELAARMWSKRAITSKELANRRIKVEFISKRRKYNADKNEDPYRLKPVRK